MQLGRVWYDMIPWQSYVYRDVLTRTPTEIKYDQSHSVHHQDIHGLAGYTAEYVVCGYSYLS